jgi:hypothetical protein
MRRGDDSWIRTRWNLKRGDEGYRGVFVERPGAGVEQDPFQDLDLRGPAFSFEVKVLQD